jgi:hypothetical protein
MQQSQKELLLLLTANKPCHALMQVALLESQLRPSWQKVLNMLPRRPLPATAGTQPAPAAAAAVVEPLDAAAAATDGPDSSSTSSSTDAQTAAAAAAAASEVRTTQQLYGGEVPEEMIQLLPTYWEQVQLQAGDVPPLASKALLRMLQASSWAEEFRDPATSQVRPRVLSMGIGLEAVVC